MDIFEELAMWHLTRSGKVFVCHQYRIAEGWSYPDFVALDFEQKMVSVVEVSAVSQPGGLLRKVLDRENQWFRKSKEQLRQAKVIDDSWKRFRVVLYIRESARDKFQKQLGESQDVLIYTLEEIGFPWNWNWPSEKAQKEADETAAED